MRFRNTVNVIFALFWTMVAANSVDAQGYRIERIASGLDQPTYVTQAPGDPSNIIYYAERITATPGSGGGFGTINDMGGIFRYDMNTRSSTLVMSLEHRQLTGDEGLAGFAFSPDFNTPGAAGYQKLYVSSSSYNNGASPIDRVEEYVASGPNGTVPTDGLGRPVVNRLILEYLHVNNQQNHTVDWVGFDPRASALSVGSPERNYLYIVTGDGDLGGSAQSRPEQKADSVPGKLLRVDVDAANGDAYPGDPNKNFAIPDSNPIPLWNSNHNSFDQLVSTTLNYTNDPMTATYAPALGEIYATGLRNGYRASFDQQTGDFWGGDVGENTREEVNFLRADIYDDNNGNLPPVDFGYAQREGTVPTSGGLGVSGSSGATTLQWDLSGGDTVIVDSTNPVREGMHATTNTPDEVRTTNRSAYIGGYVYRGPVDSLQGNYFYSDFIHSNIFMLSDFDRDIPLEDYSGTNLNQVDGVAALGTRTTVASADADSLWQSLIVDPTDPNYTAALGLSFGIGRAVSFGEDNDGNLYVIDFGSNRGDPSFGGDYPVAGLGEIFRIVPTLQLKVIVNRDTGAMTFTNATGDVTDILGYQLVSGAGSIDPNELTPITGNFDNSEPGNGSIDPNNPWEITSDPGDHEEFSEASTGTAASLDIDEEFALSPGDGWIQSIYEDLQLQVTLGDSSITFATVEFEGNGGQAFDRSDLNFNGEIDPGDWPIFRDHHLTDLSGMSLAQAYGFGDLDGDGDNDFDDFRLFQSDYVGALGASAFQALFQVPEPGTATLLVGLAVGAPLILGRRRRGSQLRSMRGGSRRIGQVVACAAAAAGVSFVVSPARADLVHQYTFNDGLATDSVGNAHGTLEGDTSVTLGVVDFPGGNDDFIDLPGFTIQINDFVDATFETWFTWRGGGDWQRIFDFGSTSGFGGNGNDYIFYTPSGAGQNRAAITDGGGGQEDVANAGSPLSTNVSYHLAVVVDDSDTDQMIVYLNGQEAGSTNFTIGNNGQRMSELDNNNAYLGDSNYTNDPSLNGTMDEFRIYDHALSPEEVEASFEAGPVPFNTFELTVNTVTGSVALANTHTSPLSLDYYRVDSSAGALDADGWNSLDDQNMDAIGAGEGESWDELGQPNSQQVAEGFLLGSTALASDSPVDLGHLFNTSVFGQGEEGDLELQFALESSDNLAPGDVTYVTPGPLDGDYNGDGTVGAADYVVWRNTLGSTTDLDADGDGDMMVDQDDYTIWAWTFGNTADGAGATAALVPEPAAALLGIVAVLGFMQRRSIA